MPNPIAEPFVEGRDTDNRADLVLIESTGDEVVTVSINRRWARNALDPAAVSALREAFATLEGADGVRVVFLRGAGGLFSEGPDLDALARASEHFEADNRDDAAQLGAMLRHLSDLPAVTVALVEGAAAGAGVGLVAACDMALATQEARFCLPEARLGLTPTMIAPYVVEAVGARRARALFATGREFTSAEALTMGLIDEVAADSAALDVARDRIAQAVRLCAPGAVQEGKRLARHIAGRPNDHLLTDDLTRRYAHGRTAAEAREGVRAAQEGRRPNWAEI
jgi:methylglutaconyl-CoA hydratase